MRVRPSLASPWANNGDRCGGEGTGGGAAGSVSIASKKVSLVPCAEYSNHPAWHGYHIMRCARSFVRFGSTDTSARRRNGSMDVQARQLQSLALACHVSAACSMPGASVHCFNVAIRNARVPHAVFAKRGMQHVASCSWRRASCGRTHQETIPPSAAGRRRGRRSHSGCRRSTRQPAQQFQRVKDIAANAARSTALTKHGHLCTGR